MYLLICEGPCNGEPLKLFDAAVAEAKRIEVGRRDRVDGGDPLTASMIDPVWLEQVKGFAYTLHERTTTDRCQCEACGTTRRF